MPSEKEIEKAHVPVIVNNDRWRYPNMEALIRRAARLRAIEELVALTERRIGSYIPRDEADEAIARLRAEGE
jgi:hypothetical protein